MTSADAARIAAMMAHHRRTVALAAPNARTRTIERLIAGYVAHHGKPPPDDWLASACAISVERVRRHRALLDGAS
jgi:hypothetical protein